MRVMVIVKANKDSEAGILPSEEMLAAMGKYNEELVKAGVMLAGEGLHPSSKGKRVTFSGGKKSVSDGPFAETKELIAGFWLWQVKNMEEAVEWLKRAPFDGVPNSRSARCSRPTTSARSSRPSCGRRKSACARRSSACGSRRRPGLPRTRRERHWDLAPELLAELALTPPVIRHRPNASHVLV